MGLIVPDSGTVVFDGFARHAVAYLPQQSEIDRSLPVEVLDLVSTGQWHRSSWFRRVDRAGLDAAWDALETVGLADFAHRPVSALSSGQFQRVLFARILTQDARLILLDEPFNAVDARTTHDLLQLVARWREEGRTVIAVLHDEEQVKRYFAQTLLLAREVVGWGATGKVLTDEHLRLAMDTAAHWQDRAPVCHVDGSPA